MGIVIKQNEEAKCKNIFFKISGELDINTASELKDTVESEYKKNPSTVNIDFSEINFMDSTGLGVLITLKKSFNEEHNLNVINAQKHVQKVFIITGLSELFLREEADCGK